MNHWQQTNNQWMFKVIGLGNRDADNGPRCLKPPIGNKQQVNLYDDSWSWVLRQSTQWHWQRVNVRGYNQLSQDNVGVWMFGGEVHRKVSVTSHCQWTSVSYATNTFGSPRKPEASRRMAGKSFQRLALCVAVCLRTRGQPRGISELCMQTC